jgi:hypothetical protein
MYRIIYNDTLNNEILNLKKNAIVKNNKKFINCSKCNKKITINEYKNKNISFNEYDIHNLFCHYEINCDLYEKINELNNNKLKISMNDLNIMDGLYEIGSKKIYIESKLSNNLKDLKYSEHYGYLEILLNNIVKICVLNKKRIDDNFKDVYMPESNIELFNYEYIFHTHPKFDKLGYRRLIIFEYPSINDLLHFIDHYNLGVLKRSLIISPEGLYIIKKHKDTNDKIIIDTDIFINKVNNVYLDCEEIIINKYYLTNITCDYFYNKIIYDLECLDKINKVLQFFNITIDYYARNNINNNYVLLSIYT